MNSWTLFVTKNKRFFQALLGTILIGVVVWKSNPKALYSQLLGAPLRFLIPWISGYYLIVVLTWAVGINALLRRIKPAALSNIIFSSFKLQILSTVIPGRLGDLGLLYFLKDNFTYGQVTAVLFVDKLITLAINSVLAIIGLGILLSWRYSAYASFIILAGLLLILWFVFKCPPDILRFGILERLTERFEGFRLELQAVIRHFNGISINLTLTIFRYLFAGVSLVVIFLWFGVKVPLFEVILIQAIVQLAVFVPLTIMGLGVQEALMVTLFWQLGVAPDIVLAAGLWARAIHLLFIVLIYVCWILINPAMKLKHD